MTVTRTPLSPGYRYTLRDGNGVLVATRYSSHRFPVALCTPDGQHMLLIPQSQAHRADPNRVLVKIMEV